MTARTPPPGGTGPTPGPAIPGRTRNRKEEMRRQHEEWLELTGKQVLENINRLRAQAEQDEQNGHR